jgi:hypothetical protein
MTAAAGDDDALDQALAFEAGFTFTSVNPMLELEKTFVPVGVDVVRNA